jgi:RimJ/RimL family protein N-acetyltransferase
MSMTNGEVACNPERLIIGTDYESVVLKQLVINDAPPMFDLIEADRGHLSQFDDETSDKYPTAEAVVMSINCPPDPRRLRFGIWDGDQMVGSINLTPDEDNYNGIIGYWVGAEHTGQHYASRALQLLINYAFQTLDVTSLSADVQVGNEASARTLERAGFAYDGQLDNVWMYENLNRDKNKVDIRQSHQVDDNISMAVIELHGSNRRQRNPVSSTKYIVQTGHVVFDVEKNESPTILSKGEHISIPANTVYRDAVLGERAVMLAISRPPFNPKNVEFIDLKR